MEFSNTSVTQPNQDRVARLTSDIRILHQLLMDQKHSDTHSEHTFKKKIRLKIMLRNIHHPDNPLPVTHLPPFPDLLPTLNPPLLPPPILPPKTRN